MDYTDFTYLAGIIIATFSLFCLWLILYPKFRDGFFMRLGLSMCTLGFGAVSLHLLDSELDMFYGAKYALSTGFMGFLLICLGYAVRCAIVGHPLRRKGDWFRDPGDPRNAEFIRTE